MFCVLLSLRKAPLCPNCEVTFAEFMKTHPLAFVRGSDVTKAMSWLRAMKTCFRLLRYPLELKVDLTKFMLQEDAIEW